MAVFLALCALPTLFLFPQEESGALGIYSYPKLKLDFPLFDLPYQIDTMNTAGKGFFGSYTSLSMDQSLALTIDVYSSMHFGMRKLYDSLTIGEIWKKAVYYTGTAAGILVFAYVFPFGYPWLHQEYTRTILTRFNINSFNGRYKFGYLTPVNGVFDDDLVRLKAESPHDFVRMEEASLEACVSFSNRMLRNLFFYDLHDLSNITAFLSAFVGIAPSVVALFDKYGINDAESIINERYENDGLQETRALYGLAPFNWVYDLFRPDEAYEARGLHASGDGIARYISPAQLSEAETVYLIKHGWLSFLNLASPILYGFNSFPLGKTGIEWNVAFNHFSTSFGSDTPFQLLAKISPFNLLFTYHSYVNYNRYFPAVEAELVDFPLRLTPQFGLLLSPRVLLGMQPKDQGFMTKEPEFLGLLACRVDFPINNYFFPYVDISLKTDGWVSGNEYLNRNVSFKAGISLRFK
jgi:hypothetical protein